MDALLRSMTVFAVTVEAGSMAAAARTLDLSASAISQHIHKLENQLKISLLHRNTRQLTVTEAGQVFYQSCQQTIQQWQQTKQQLNDLRQLPQGELRISAPVGFAACGLLSQPLQQLLHSHPQLNIRLFVQDDEFDLISNRIDLALCIRQGAMPDSRLVARHLANWELILAAAPEYLASKGIRQPQALTEPTQLSQLDWLQHQNNKAEHLVRRQAGQQQTGQIAAPVKLRLNNMQALIQFSRDGLGFAALPKPEISRELADGRLVQLLPEWQLPPLSIYAVTSARDPLPGKVKTAIRLLSKRLLQYHQS